MDRQMPYPMHYRCPKCGSVAQYTDGHGLLAPWSCQRCMIAWNASGWISLRLALHDESQPIDGGFPVRRTLRQRLRDALAAFREPGAVDRG